MSKDVSFQGRPPSKDNPRAAAAFAALKIAKPPEKMKRLTIDIPASLHSRVKLKCVQDDTTIADVVRNYLEKQFCE
jgi:hypothetical protein